MRTPSFRYMGGKARLRKWLVDKFPPGGNTYLEPFAGVGNVFFHARQTLRFKEWCLGDINPFLVSLVHLDVDDLPSHVTRDDFLLWKTADSDVARVIEPRITFAGKGYRYGFNGGKPSDHTPYSGRLYKRLCTEAQRLLSGARIVQAGWDDWDWHLMGEEDFVYLDPPYVGTNTPYPNINHTQLVDMLNVADFRWALSGYENDLYNESLDYICRYSRERNAEIRGSSARSRSLATEVLWTNYKQREGE